MPNFTKQAIKASFWKLLRQQPINQISVRDIVEDCGVNRNSFYYHFRDIPALLEEILLDLANTFMKKYPTIPSLEEGAEATVQFILENKKAIYHVYHSASRNLYETQLIRVCHYVVSTYFDAELKPEAVPPDEREGLVLFFKCELIGLFIDWINAGMSESAVASLRHLFAAFRDILDDMIKRCQ